MKTKAISTALQAANAPAGVHKVTGAVGLYLKVGEGGSGSWFYRYRWGDRRREFGLGSRAVVSLAEARKLALVKAALCRGGKDAIEERRRERAANAAKSRVEPPPTFEQMVESYLAAHGDSWKHKYARAAWLNPVVKFAYPVIGRLSLDQIKISHVVAIIERAEQAGAPEAGRRVRARIERVINAAIALSGVALRNPADGKLIAAARPSRRKGERPHYRAVRLDRAPEVFRTLERQDGTAFAARRFMILTAARPSEALNACWGEVDFDKRLWTIPASRMKSARAHVVPLSAAALAVLERQTRVRTGDAVFPGRSGSSLSYSNFADAPMKAGIDAGTAHGWRSVFRDFCGDIGDVPRDLAEAALAHSLGATEGAYRRLTAVEKRRGVMEAYSRWLNGEGAQVLAFPTSKTA
jgi:integrase